MHDLDWSTNGCESPREGVVSTLPFWGDPLYSDPLGTGDLPPPKRHVLAKGCWNSSVSELAANPTLHKQPEFLASIAPDD